MGPSDGECLECGVSGPRVDTNAYGAICKDCLFDRVSQGHLMISGSCYNCGDSEELVYCSTCGDNHDYCHDDDEPWCHECGDNSYVLCSTCAKDQWGTAVECDKCSEPGDFVSFCIDHNPYDKDVLFTETAKVDKDGVMTVGDTVVNWS